MAKPTIRGLRFPVSRLLGLLASGETRESIVKAYPYLKAEDIQEALNYTARRGKTAPGHRHRRRLPLH